jgi:MFS family permease
MSPSPSSPPRAARAATFAYFGFNGFIMGTWVVHIPAITRRTAVGPGTLGWLLLVLGTAAFVGMQAVGPLTDRLGARRTVPIGGVLCSSALILPGLVHSVWALAGAVAALGLGNGCLDVAMNTHAVHVERAYGRPIMAAFHAIWSLGGVLASLVGAVTIARGWPIAATFSGIATVTLVVNAVAARSLLPAEPDGLLAAPTTATSAQSTRTPRRIWALAAVALAVMLCEGVAYDWSTTHVRTVLGASAATASLAYGAYATAATAGRLTVDRVAARFGPVAVLRYGASTAGLGMVVTALAADVPTAIAGWTLVGIGLSGCVPQLLSAAGAADPNAAGTNVARVAGLGYLGLLAGPATIGGLSHFVALNTSFLFPAMLCAVAACAGSAAMRTTTPATPRRAVEVCSEAK